MRKIPQSDLETALRTMFEGVTSGRGPTAGAVAHRKALRMARHAAAAARLERDIGGDAEQVRRLQASVAADDVLRVPLNIRTERERDRPRLRPQEWMVLGRVLRHDGAPATDVLVRLLDRDDDLDDVVGVGRPDQFGDWQIGPCFIRDVAARRNETSELYVNVYGPRNQLLFDGHEDARLSGERVEYVEITLPSPDTS